jgi:hypothetical protein
MQLTLSGGYDHPDHPDYINEYQIRKLIVMMHKLEIFSVEELSQNNCGNDNKNIVIVKTQTQHQLNSTEFEVRIHSYM